MVVTRMGRTGIGPNGSAMSVPANWGELPRLRLGKPMVGATVGKVRAVLRLEGLCVLAASAFAYSKFGAGWGVFFVCFFLPDLSFLGYLAGPRVGALTYNGAHSYVGAVACLAASIAWPSQVPLAAGLIWVAHIGFDRALGYGLKYSEGFSFTHLGPIGRSARKAATPPSSG
jgi:hypothetical protein